MIEKIRKLATGEFMRYVLVGGTTTLLDLAVFYVLCEVRGIDPTVGNVISIVIAMLYAYVANKLFVFQSHCADGKELAGEFARFVSGRLSTMALEIGSVFVLCNLLGIDSFIGKLLTQGIVFVANYLLGKFFAFRNRAGEK